MVEENRTCPVYIKDEQQVGGQHIMAPLAASNGPFMSCDKRSDNKGTL